MNKPPLFPDNIPASLKALPQWVCWRHMEVDGRRTKVPFNPKGRYAASTITPQDWTTYEEALAVYQNSDFSGIGIVLAGSGQVGFDLDKVLIDGQLHPAADALIRKLNSYTEITQSGTGIHVFALGKKPIAACAIRNHVWGAECACFEKSKFFAISGNLLEGYPAELQPRQAELDEICANLWPTAYATAERVRRVLALHSAGKGIREIARELDIPPATVTRYIQKSRPAPAGVPPQACGTLVEQGGGTGVPQAVLGSGTGVPPAELASGTGVPGGVPPQNPGVPPGNLGGVPQGVPRRESVQFDDDEILDLIRKSRAAAKFEDLWSGNWNTTNTRFVSQSEADCSLCWHLAFYTKDAAQIDRIYRQSGMMRDKWDEPRPEGTYGSVTIDKALNDCTEQYHGRRRGRSRAQVAVLHPNSTEAATLFERSKEFVAELRASPNLTRLAGAITEFLWQLPDLYLDVVKKDLADCLNGSFKVSSFNKAIQQERVQRKKTAVASAAREKTTTAQAALWNFRVVDGVDKEGNHTESTEGLPIAAISESLRQQVGNWPCRVEALLFTEENGAIRYLENRDALFAWIQERMPVYWEIGQDATRKTLISRAEFMSHLQAQSTSYKSVEHLPHEPPMEDHYYAWKWPDGYKSTGEYFERLLSYFDNPLTDLDAILIRAAFLTPAWGGQAGKRPAIAVLAAGRGFGKSTLAEVIGRLYGGHVELTTKEKDEERLVSRLLTPSALTKRIVRVDNLKGEYGSGLVEGLITAPAVSGYRLYQGEASRPNTLTFFMTGIKMRLSRDMAERSFIIRMGEPKFRRGWDDGVKDFVEQYRHFILADIVTELSKPPASVEVSDRWMAWVDNVLARCTTRVAEVVALTQDRRRQCDEDQDDSGTIMEAIDRHLAERHEALLLNLRMNGETASDVAPEEEVFISATDMTDLLHRKLREPLTAADVRRRMEGHMEAGRLPRVQSKRTETARGYLVRRLQS